MTWPAGRLRSRAPRAVLMAVLGKMVPAAIDFINVVHDSAALMLVRGPEFLSVFDKPQRDALAMLFLRLHGQQVIAAEILWGLWLFPRFLGVWLIFNCFAYLAESLTGLFFPLHQDTVSMIVFPAILGEVAFVLWLLIRGVKRNGTAPVTA